MQYARHPAMHTNYGNRAKRASRQYATTHKRSQPLPMQAYAGSCELLLSHAGAL